MLFACRRAPSTSGTNSTEWCPALPNLEKGQCRQPPKQQYFAAPNHPLQGSRKSPHLCLRGPGAPALPTAGSSAAVFLSVHPAPFKDLKESAGLGGMDHISLESGGGGVELLTGSFSMEMQSSSSSANSSSCTSPSASSCTSCSKAQLVQLQHLQQNLDHCFNIYVLIILLHLIRRLILHIILKHS